MKSNRPMGKVFFVPTSDPAHESGWYYLIDMKEPVGPFPSKDDAQINAWGAACSDARYAMLQEHVRRHGLPLPRKVKALAAILAIGCALSACVPAHGWRPGPQIADGNAADFERDRARCSIAARHGDGGGFFFGPPAFVLGAAIGSAIGNANSQQADFNDCMSANGWIPAP